MAEGKTCKMGVKAAPNLGQNCFLDRQAKYRSVIPS